MTLRPATPEDLAHSLRAVHESRSPVDPVDLGGLHRILEHTPEDLTVTVEAGATFATLQRALAARGQWLPMDPPHPERRTLAELLDTDASGPRRFGFGIFRDHVIGLRIALADGRLIRSGGKVVKNVAGYDLMKLFIGARGTLGVIVEATFKLLPLPEAEAFIQCRCDSLDAVEPLLDAVLQSELTPTVLDLHNIPGEVSRASTGAASCLVLGFAGARPAVDWQLALACQLGFTEATTLDYETRFHAPDLPPPRQLSVLPSRVVETARALGPAPFVARAGNGLLFHRTDVAAPAMDVPRALMERVKQTFDPNRIFPELAL